MINIFKKFSLLLIVFLFVSGITHLAFAQAPIKKTVLPDSNLYLWVKFKETFRLNLLTYKKVSKAKVLDQMAEQRISEIQYAALLNNHQAAETALNRYEKQKNKALDYAEKAGEETVVKQIQETTLDQQREMTQLQLKSDNNPVFQQNIVQVQKDIAQEIKNTVEVSQGQQEMVKIDTQIQHIWRDPNTDVKDSLAPVTDNWEYAPGTQGRDVAGKVILDSSGKTISGGETGMVIKEDGGGTTSPTQVIENGQSQPGVYSPPSVNP